MDYVSRIFDNLLSNIVKYGDAGAPVIVRLDDTDDAVAVSFENRKRVPEEGTESNRIGLQNMRNMMRRMGEAVGSGRMMTAFCCSSSLRYPPAAPRLKNE